MTIVSGSASFGAIPSFTSAINPQPFRFSIVASAPFAHQMSFTLRVTAQGGYSTNIPLTIQTASPVIYPPATITTQTWSKDRTYIINKETGIPAGSTLTIEPGTEIRFAAGYSLNIAGELVAVGTNQEPILFTSNNPNPASGDWGAIRFLDSSTNAVFDVAGNYLSGSILSYSTIEYGMGIELDFAAPFISNNKLQNLKDNHAIYVEKGLTGNADPGLVVAENTLDNSGIDISLQTGNYSIVKNDINSLMNGIHVLGGSGEIVGNTIRCRYTGIHSDAQGTISNNQVTGCDMGLSIGGGIIRGNLLAGNEQHGIYIFGGSPAVNHNTILANGENGIFIQNGTPVIQNNNLIAGLSGYALNNGTAATITATQNWWGASGPSTIQEAIYDGLDEFGLGTVDSSSPLSGPEADAPAYVTFVSISPDTTLGIQTASFDVHFSREMDPAVNPVAGFRSQIHNTWDQFSTVDMGLQDGYIEAIAVDNNENVWVGTQNGEIGKFDGSSWTVHHPTSKGISTIATSQDGSVWLGTYDSSIYLDETNTIEYFHRTWESAYGGVNDIAVAPDKTVWFVSELGVVHFDGENFVEYNSSNSGLPTNSVSGITITPDGTVWFGTRIWVLLNSME